MKYPSSSVPYGTRRLLSLLLCGLGLLAVQSSSAAPASISSTGSLAQARLGHTATLLPNGKVLVVGGFSVNDANLDSAELYNPATGTWSRTGSLTTGRSFHTATLLSNGKVLVAGGSGSSEFLASAELYNPATGTWSATGSLTTSRSNSTMNTLPDGRVLVAGGNNSSGAIASAELYDPATGNWTTTGSLLFARTTHTGTTLENGKVLAAGGNSFSGPLNSAELYDPVTGVWSKTFGDLKTARRSHTATLLPNGFVLVAGGGGITDGANVDLASAEFYLPRLDGWATTGSLVTARQRHTATALPDGQVLVVGGRNATGVLATMELYSGGDWTETSSLANARNLHTTTVLQTGKVLVAAGFVADGPNASAELYVPPTTQLLNISTRLRVLTGDSALIGGFIITGTEPKQVIIRALGPSLSSQGIEGVLRDPTLELFGANGSITKNDNWKDDQQAKIKATGIAPTKDAEAAIVRTLAPGNYTAIVSGKRGTTGIGLIEVYDLDQAAKSQLANISSRGIVDTGDDALIGGFIVGGGGAGTTVVVRALGPSLEDQVTGELANPTLELKDANGTTVRANDDWKSDQQAELQAIGIQPKREVESALIETVAAGNYTAIVRGKGNSNGIGLVEVYDIGD